MCICDDVMKILSFPYQADKHPPVLIQLICSELSVTADQILDFELCVADTQPAVSRFERRNLTLSLSADINLVWTVLLLYCDIMKVILSDLLNIRNQTIFKFFSIMKLISLKMSRCKENDILSLISMQ